MIKQCLELGVPLDDIANQVEKRVERKRATQPLRQEAGL